MTFDQALARIDTKKARARYLRDRRDERTHVRVFPTAASLAYQVLIEQQGPLITVNEDGEFSSRGLTDWYVREFCKINHLRRTA